MISLAHAKLRGMTSNSFLGGIVKGASKAEEEFGIISRYIVNGIRHLGPDSVYDTAKEVLENRHNYVVGFGLAGDELNFPPKLFVKAFDMIKEENFPITVHAGEWDGPEKIREAIKLLHPTRLGHGVRSIEDPMLVDEICNSKIVLEICPTSNVATKIYTNYKEHPVKKLYDKGVKITVNSDDPPFFNATVAGEYKVMSKLGLSDSELLSLTHNAISYSFCEKSTKNKLLKRCCFLFLIERGGNFTLVYPLNFLNPSNIGQFRASLKPLKMTKNDKKWQKMIKNGNKKSFWSILVEKRSQILKIIGALKSP